MFKQFGSKPFYEYFIQVFVTLKTGLIYSSHLFPVGLKVKNVCLEF